MLLNYFLPSFKVSSDVQFEFNKIDNIEPISINGLSLIQPIANKLKYLREKNKNLRIEKSLKKLTLIIPYRNRQPHLDIFLPFIKNYLMNQGIDFEIIVVEQTNELAFNKAKLMNIGAINARDNCDYFVFHDVDLLPENIDYRYCNFTEKLFYEIKHDEQYHYKKYKPSVLGGAVAIPKNIFFDINGYSNNYWQWGREDDDLFLRHIFKGYIPLYDKNGKFTAMQHEHSLTKNNNGISTDEKDILKHNQKLFKKNKKYYKKMRRSLVNQDMDGISTLAQYSILKCYIQDNVKYILVRMDE